MHTHSRLMNLKKKSDIILSRIRNARKQDNVISSISHEDYQSRFHRTDRKQF